MWSRTRAIGDPFAIGNKRSHVDSIAWADYLRGFHDERPGVTEAILAAATSPFGDPYCWLCDPLPPAGLVLDVACGSGPTLSGAGAQRWIGIDRSFAELGIARRRGHPVVRADALALPVATGAAHAVVCSMALMILPDPRLALLEMRRVLRPGGMLVALVPASGPLSWADRLRYARLLVAVRRRSLGYPNDEQLRDARRLFDGAGFTLRSDEQKRFTFTIAGARDADTLVRSLYLPGLKPARENAARRVTRRWSGHQIGIPLRRLIALAPDEPRPAIR